ncbi:MAG: Ig-like domain-containing protein [Promethearchaeota archaeon]
MKKSLIGLIIIVPLINRFIYERKDRRFIFRNFVVIGSIFLFIFSGISNTNTRVLNSRIGIDTTQIGNIAHDTNKGNVLESIAANSIELLTPENKTYHAPMSGYYPASWGFENNDPGMEPSDWYLTPTNGSSFYRVNAEYDGHKNVLEMRKYNGTTQVTVIKNFSSSVTAGTVEFWLQKDTGESGVHLSDPTRFFLLNSSGHPQVVFFVERMDLYPYNYIPTYDVVPKDTWHHFRIDFDVSQGGWQLQFNNYQFGSGYTLPFYYPVVDHVSGFQMASTDFADFSDYGAYLDAVGYSWDPGYTVGDNLNEGLLLSYYTPTPLNWTGYSLDGGTNVTILGNTTIPMPSDEIHTIQVFGNDSLGNWYSSELRPFRCSVSLNIYTPEEKTYLAPMSGYYPATFGFENEIDGTEGTNLEFIDEYYQPGEQNAYIIVNDGPWYDHNNFLVVYDRETAYNTSGVHYFDNPPTTGTIEFYNCYAADSDGYHYFILRAMDDTAAIQIRIDVEGIVEYFDGTSWHLISDQVYYEWYHHSITFDCKAGTKGQFTWITRDTDGTEVGRVENIDFLNDLNTIDELYLGSDDAANFGVTYWDAFGFSWEPNYNVGDNLDEGLLLSYYTPTPLVWTGYSLNGGTNITILGNTTIPMPFDGTHTIQVFGNDSAGNRYSSELRSFQVASIELLTPENITYNAPMGGYYPATFGFENELHKTRGTDIEFIDEWYEAGEVTEIVVYEGPLDGHYNFLVIADDIDASGANASGVHYFDNPPTTGTIEFYNYYSVPMSLGSHYFILRDIDDTVAVQIRINTDGGRIEYFNGTSWQNITNQVPITWYHHSITFDCEAGSNGRFTWITRDTDGTEVGRVENIEFLNDLNTIDELYLGSDDPANFGDTLWDAFGFSWDPNYNIGDNLDEGLLLSYNTPTPLVWTGYSLNGGTNITILGNTTIRMPLSGTHTIQVFGNDSAGNWYSSELRSFETITPPSIIGPADFAIELGDIGKNFLWSLSDPYPANYIVYRNGTIFKEENWSAVDLTVYISLDRLSEGNHNFTCVARNTFDRIAIDEVWITVGPDETPPDISSPSDISFEEGSIGYSILWTGSDNFPWWASVHRNDSLIYDQAWVGNDIEISLDNLTAGLYIFNCTLFDEPGNSAYDIVEVNVTEAVPDTRPPKVTAPDPLEFEEGTTGHILTWICSDDHPYAYKIQINDTDELFSAWRGGNVTFTVDDLPVGVWEVNLTLYDLSGNLASSPVIVTVNPEAPDTTAPTVSHPAELIIAENTAGTIVWEVSDKHPDWYTISRNGTVIYEQHYWVSGIIQFHFTSLPLGTWEFNLTVWDEAGNSASGIAIVKVLPGSAFDTNPPEISQVKDIQYTYGTTNNYLIVYLFDKHPQGYSISITTDTNITEQTWTSPNIRVEICLDGLAVGSYTVTITAWDTFGNTEARTVKVTVQGDVNPPTISYQPDITAYENTNITLTWQVSDESPSHFELFILPEGKVNQSGSWSGNSINITLGYLPTGTYQYQLIVYDASGNYAVDDFTLTVIKSSRVPGFEILTAVLFLLFFTKFRLYFNLKRRKEK